MKVENENHPVELRPASRPLNVWIRVLSILSALGLQSLALGANYPGSFEILPSIGITEYSKLDGFLIGLVEEHEGRKVDKEGNVLRVDVNTATFNKCQINSEQTSMVCNYDYLQGRWNGEVEAKFKVLAGRITQLDYVSFDGHF